MFDCAPFTLIVVKKLVFIFAHLKEISNFVPSKLVVKRHTNLV